ncbi:MAG: TraR/DksA family transcriptional regulator [Chitinophagaceae bacterium]|nr:TraR/DksA family transcriptional regulator [Chitinophagaceae bacterium]
MANKKPAPKKAAKPAPKKAAPKKAAKPAAKPAAKKAAPAKAAPKKAAPKAKPVPKAAVKPAPKKAAVPARKPEPAKPAPKAPVAKPAPAPAPAPQPVAKKAAEPEAKSLVSIKPAPKPIIKKEPPKPSKVVIPKTTIKTVVKYEPEFTKSVLDTPVNEQTGPTMRYSDADLAEFREIINKKLDAAKKELAYLQGLITRRDEGGDMDEARYMTMEDGSVSMEREQLSQMASRQITFIDHLEKALMRIENKTYGVCRVTGKLIDKARLRAVPHATLSIEAKQMMNK